MRAESIIEPHLWLLSGTRKIAGRGTVEMQRPLTPGGVDYGIGAPRNAAGVNV
jgi:hypothetical protein